jgi:hypothetical protein
MTGTWCGLPLLLMDEDTRKRVLRKGAVPGSV